MGYTSFTTGNEGALITAGIFPGDMVRNGTVVDPWGNNVSLTSDGNATEGVLTVGGGGSETADQCTNVVTSLKDYVSLAVGGTTFTQATPPPGLRVGSERLRSRTQHYGDFSMNLRFRNTMK